MIEKLDIIPHPIIPSDMEPIFYKINELIDTINNQQKEIEKLKRDQSNLKKRTSGLARVGGIIR